MKVLIANPGSTSYKCKLFEMDTEKILFQASVERIGEDMGSCSWTSANQEKMKKELAIPDYETAVKMTLDSLNEVLPVSEVDAVGFKTVLAKDITGCVLLDDRVLEAMKAYLPLAPVHNQVYLTAISIFKKLLKDKPLIGLFETAFHVKIPPEAYIYGIPFEWYEKYAVRKYGFHGASHHFIADRVRELYGAENIISCHLGGSSSVCAIHKGMSVDTSMGMSPQSGLLNAKRVGDLDPFALLYLMDREKLSTDRMREILITQGGVQGISGIGGDLREVERVMDQGSERAALAFKTFAYVVKRYIGEYLAILNGTDYIVFTGGIGEHSSKMRKAILKDMENLGIILDEEKNTSNPREGIISSSTSKVKVAVIPTNEELIVAREVTKKLMNKSDEK